MEKLNEFFEQAKEMSQLHGPEWSSALCCVSFTDGKEVMHHAIISDSTNDFVIDTGSDSNEASWLCDYLELCSPANIIAIAEAFRALEQRAEAAEAKLVNQDYFGSLVSKARISADKAMVKFPQPNYVLLKVAEEAGEVVQAGVHYAENRMSWGEVEGEIVQLMAMLIRLVTEGDQVNGITPPESCRDFSPAPAADHVPDGWKLVPVPPEFLSAEQNSQGMFELSEDCMTRLAIALSQQAKGLVIKPGHALVPGNDLLRVLGFAKFVIKCVRKNGEYAPLSSQEPNEIDDILRNIEEAGKKHE